ncbi:hypothetical protein K8R04_00660 [Candidatus Uhrbacteria bacterium]|nr:hypothetical protein [Candidatus Uhrbacteria bacterium]
MAKSWSIFGWILLGAAAAAIGTGYFLHISNTDRARLVEATEQARKQSEGLSAASKKLADEANQKLDTASDKIREAQNLIHKYDEERDLLARAEPLVRTRASTNWREWLNVPLGFSIRLPMPSGNAGNELYFDFGWLKMEPYNPDREAILRAQTTTTAEAVYFVDGRLLIGTSGTEWVLHDLSGASSTMLIWAKPGNAQAEKNFIESLSTLTFRR